MEPIIFTTQEIVILFVVAIWEMIWKGIGMWHAAKDGHRRWFIAILILNTFGILPIVYLSAFKKGKKLNILELIRDKLK